MASQVTSRRTAIVTGGAQGIGRAVAQRLVTNDYAVVIADVESDAGAEAEAALEGAMFIETDVSQEDSVQACIEQTIEQFGRLDALVNNAGIADPQNPPVESLSLEAWSRVIAVNLTGCFLCSKHAVPHLRKRRGAIVNVASTRALMSEPNTEAYSASKGGIVALTHALAISLGPAVRVNAVSPGWIDVRAWQKESERDTSPLEAHHHRQHPAGRVGLPQDVADLIAYLLSEDAGFMTGQNIVVDGGITRKMIYE